MPPNVTGTARPRVKQLAKTIIEEINKRFGYYKSPLSGRNLTDALRKELNNMESILTQAYTAIAEAEKTVDAENIALQAKVDTLSKANISLSTHASELAEKAGEHEKNLKETQVKVLNLNTTMTNMQRAIQAPHDGGYIFTVKGRKVGSAQDRGTLDTIIDRLDPQTPAAPEFKSYQEAGLAAAARQQPKPAPVAGSVREKQPDVIIMR